MRGATLADQADALVKAFVAAKFKHAGVSVALYAASEDLGGKKIARDMQLRSVNAIREMIESSCERVSGDPACIAETLQGAISGVSRANPGTRRQARCHAIHATRTHPPHPRLPPGLDRVDPPLPKPAKPQNPVKPRNPPQNRETPYKQRRINFQNRGRVPGAAIYNRVRGRSRPDFPMS